MSFLTGSVTYFRFRVDGPPPGLFDSTHLEALNSRAAGRSRLASADGIEIGWSAGDSILDTDFTLEKNVYPGHLLFELRIDTDRLPADRLKAYYQVELKALAANNPSGLPSARQKREAKEAARDRLEAESKDGRFRKQKCIPVMWSSERREVLFGASSLTHLDLFTSLFQQTFGRELKPVTAGEAAFQWAETHDSTRATEDASPSPFVVSLANRDIAWIADDKNRDWLGNEFALWLWWHLENDADTIKLADGSDATAMIARKLRLDCPRGMSGRDGFAHEGPSRLPEAKRAIQGGKLPRSLGLTVVRHDDQFEFTLQPEMMSVGSCRMPSAPDDIAESRARAEWRLGAVSDLIDTIDGLYGVFLAIRLSAKWADTLGRMQKWLVRGERIAA